MSKNRRIIALLACVALAVLFAAFLHRSPEPSYGGLSLSEWVRRLDWDQSEKTREAAGEAIRHIGTNALPCLLEWMHYEEPPAKQRFLEVLNDSLNWFGIRRPIGYDEKMRVIRSQRAVIALGQGARPAIPELVRLMNDPKAPQTARNAAAVLAKVNAEEALSPLLVVLTNPAHPARFVVALNIRGLGTNARPAIPALIRCLQDTNPVVAIAAATSLGELKLEPAIVVPVLAAILQHTNAARRALAMRTLQQFAAEARPAVPALVDSLNDPDLKVRRSVTNALLKIAPEALTNAPPR